MKNILKNYRRRLLNLGTSNRSLLLMRLGRDMQLDVESINFLNSEPAFDTIVKLLSGKKNISLCPFADSRHIAVNPVSRRLQLIRRKADMIYEERGSKELFIGWPFVHGKFADGTPVRCPLLFFPIRLEVSAGQEWVMVPDSSQQPQFNQNFLLAYAHYTGAPLAEELSELDLSTLPSHPLEFRTILYNLLKEHKLEINVGRELFADKLKPFREFTKADYEAHVKPGQLYLELEAVIGVFPQAVSYLLNDYDELTEREDLLEMEDIFGNAVELGSTTQAQQLLNAFELDASQELALQKVRQGKSLVVQGPPGTGKSQLICNLISDFTARGKKVLVVSQKRAALDVVHQRLSEKGVGDFSALVHDINADRKTVFKQLQYQIEQLDEYKKQNLALNSIYTDRAFLEASRSINRITGKLENFKNALFSTDLCGWSAKELYLKSSPHQPHIELPKSFRKFTSESLIDILPRLRKYLEQALQFGHQDFAWKDRHSMKGYSWSQRLEIEKAISEAPQVFTDLQHNIEWLSGFTLDIGGLSSFFDAKALIAETSGLLAEQSVCFGLKQLLHKQVQSKKIENLTNNLKQLYLVSPAPDAAISENTLENVKEAIVRYEQQAQSIFLKLAWIFSGNKKILKEALATYRLTLNEAGVSKLQHRLQLRQQAIELMQELNTLTGSSFTIKDLPTKVLENIKVLEQAIKVKQNLKKLYNAKVFHKDLWNQEELNAQLNKLLENITQLEATYKGWLKYLTPSQVSEVIKDEKHRNKLLKELPVYFEKLVAFDTLKDTLNPTELEHAELILNAKVKSADEGEQLFLNSLCLSWLQVIEDENPELRMPSNGEIDELERELQKAFDEKQKLSHEIVLSGLREQTYKNIELNRLGNVVTYRRLYAQVVKKRSLYPIRKLFTMFSDEILDLIPCWMASPETVSAVFPLESCFDLVIFDEASQCFSEMGIPAILRGKQIVVAGDQQQLKPSDIYRVRWSGGDEEEAEELSAESLLQLCSLYLPQVMLTQHYRSRYPELIEFSNKFFYQNKLELIPELQDANDRQPAIQFIKVHGVWQNNTNILEAERVVELVLELLQAQQTNLGVITFNYQQQVLIQDLLEEKAQEKEILIPDSVVVKNIENIQGDEKEVIILSVGYAPDAKGKFNMQFGSLNQSGGENRLNVAITRAKQQVLVVSSIRAEQLQVDNASHAGPKLLKDYLYYAQQVSRRYFRYQPKNGSMPSQIPLLKDYLQEGIRNLKAEAPFADLSILENENYIGVLLTDDDLYYSQEAIRYAHADLPKQLNLRNWPYLKVYSRQYWENPESLKEMVLNHFKTIGSNADGVSSSVSI